MNWFMLALSKYAQFSGRSTRQEYWMYVLVYVIIAIVLGVIEGVLHTRFLGVVLTLALLLPSLSVSARRLHDTGRSGWWQLLNLIPLVGWIVMIVFLVQDSAPDNQYGPNPKGGLAPAAV